MRVKGSCIPKGILAGLLVLCLSSGAQAGLSIEMSPARMEIQANPGKTVRAVVKLRTRGRATQKVEVTKGFFGLTDDCTPVFDPPKDAPQSAAAWISLSNTSFSINPNQEKLLRLEISVPAQAQTGGYRAAIFFTPPQPDTKTKKQGATLFLQGRLALLIYVTVGEAKPDGEIKAWEWRRLQPGKPDKIAFQVTNRGTAHLRLAGVAQVSDNQGKKYEAMVAGLPVLPGRTAWIPLEFQESGPVPGSPVSINAAIDLGQGEKRIYAQVGGRK